MTRNTTPEQTLESPYNFFLRGAMAQFKEMYPEELHKETFHRASEAWNQLRQFDGSACGFAQEVAQLMRKRQETHRNEDAFDLRKSVMHEIQEPC